MPQELNVLSILQSLQTGETVFMAGSASECVELTHCLQQDPQLGAGVTFVTSFVPGINAANLAQDATGRRMQVFFMQPAFQATRRSGALAFCPWSYSGIQQWLSGAASQLDTVIVLLSEPDADGFCSLGPSVEFMPALLKGSRRLLGIVNPNVPYVPGAARLHLTRLSAFARSTAPLRQYDAGRSNPVTDRIAEHLAALIPDGATLQLGLGKVPNQLAGKLKHHRQLRLHSGMLSDASLDLLACGALRGDVPMVSTVAVGSAAFYAQLGHVENLSLVGVDHTHDPQVLSGLSRLHAINSALEVDLMGQVNAEMLDGQHISGPGGLPDFAHAARRNGEGLSVIALPSSDPSGRVSRLVPQLASGTPVTVPQHDVDAVVTEYGVAMLRGLPLDERMQRLTAIAHPDHRARLQAHGASLLRAL